MVGILSWVEPGLCPRTPHPLKQGLAFECPVFLAVKTRGEVGSGLSLLPGEPVSQSQARTGKDERTWSSSGPALVYRG